MKSKAKLWATPIDGVYICEILFAKKNKNLKAKITKRNIGFKRNA